jgi:hypothetical protein
MDAPDASALAELASRTCGPHLKQTHSAKAFPADEVAVAFRVIRGSFDGAASAPPSAKDLHLAPIPRPLVCGPLTPGGAS